MSEFNGQSDDSADGSTRRSVLGSTALATMGIGLGGVGTAVAQEDGGDVSVLGDDDNTGDEEWFDENEASNAAIYRDQWVPNGLFTIASPVMDFTPDAPGIEDNFWNDYNTRVIRFIGTNEHVLFFPQDAATIGPYEDDFGYVVDDDYVEGGDVVVDGSPVGDDGGLDEDERRQLRPTIWIMSRDNQLLSGDDYVVSVDFSPIPEEEEEAVWNEVEDDFFDGGSQSGTQTATPSGNITEPGN